MHIKKFELCIILLKIAAIVFFMSAVSGVLFEYIPPLPPGWAAVFDSVLVTLTATPLMGVFVIAPYIAAQQESGERYALAIRAANSGLWDWDIENNTILFSEKFLSTLGMTAAELNHAEQWMNLVHPEDRSRLKRELDNSINAVKNGAVQCEYRIRHAAGRYVWVLNRWLSIRKRDKTIRLIGAQTDLTALKKAEEKWAYETSYDNLTQLPNRRSMLEKIEEAMHQQRTGDIKGFIFLYIDLDNFKRINDSVGNFAGDELLVKVAERLKKTLRPQDIIARLGGDEFGVILHSVENAHEARFVVERLIKNISESLLITGYTLSPSLSIGALSVSQDSEYMSAEEILRDADLALNYAKTNGKERFSFFSPEMRHNIVKEFEISHSLKKAIDNHEFSLFYQPIVDVDTLQVKGFEALVRWISPERGIIYPDSFIPIAEESDLIFELGRLCIRQACQSLKNWMTLFSTEKDLFVTINLSGKQILDPFLLYELQQCVQMHKLDPACIHIELTENILITNKPEVKKVIEKLKEFGITLSIDDFGTGYSSLNTLGQFPFDVLKIDRSFIEDIASNSKNRDMVAMIISLGKAMGFYVIIEGIETMEQYKVIKTLNPAYLQGYLFSQPLPEDILSERLNKSFNPKQWM